MQPRDRYHFASMKASHLVRKSFVVVLVLIVASVDVLLAREPVFDGLGPYSRPVTTASATARRYFNQGLGFYHGFNHGAAIRAFQEAAKADPKCAMAHWGIALANGPHINFPLVPPPAAEAAWKELQLAQQNAEKASPVEKALIDALGHRYANPQPEDRKPLDEAYATAMREVWKQFPDDQDVGALFAESMMDLRPWDQWTLDGQPNPGTEEILATLDAVLTLNQNHPFANHLYIHAVEASRNPERADAAADRLRNLQPGLAHNVHMPSHIDIRRGRWQQAIETNEKAIVADKRYRKIVGPPTGLLPVYAAHNRHMLAYGALMTGQRELAMKNVRAMVTELPAKFVKESAAFADGFFAVPLEVLVRFGRWDEILKESDKYPNGMPFVRAFHHAARATAYAAKGDTPNARKEQTLFVEGAKLVPAETQLGNNSAAAVISLATHMLEGEILVAEKNVDAGIAELQTAVKEEDALKYDEPPAWMIPIRHSLGAVLMKAGRFADAEQVYRADLAKLPENGWSLYGLADSLRQQKKSEEEAAAVNTKFTKTWAKADTKIATSCLCQAKK
jgi:tetratricopeptide (TPR) repeat protein